MKTEITPKGKEYLQAVYEEFELMLEERKLSTEDLLSRTHKERQNVKRDILAKRNSGLLTFDNLCRLAGFEFCDLLTRVRNKEALKK